MPSFFSRFVFAAVQEPLLLTGCVFLASLLLLSLARVRAFVVGVFPRHGRFAATVLAVGLLALYLGIVAWYVALPSFAGDVEPMIASVSWALQKGQPLYHALDAAERYSALYGPSVYIFNGLFLRLLGPSIVSAKVAGALTANLSLLFLFVALRGWVSRRIALSYCAFAVLAYFIHGPFSFLSRPDPLLLMTVSFGLLCAARAPGRWAVLGVAVSLAASIDLKIHAFLYFLPLLAFMKSRLGMRSALLAGALGGALSVLPFVLAPAISLRNYVVWLTEATRHGLDAETFKRTLEFALFFSLPVLVFLFPIREIRSWVTHNRLFLIALGLAASVLLVFAAKPGAGLNHLLPLLPVLFFASACLLAERRRASFGWQWLQAPSRLAGIFACLLVTAFIGSVVEYKCVRKIHGRSLHGEAITRDIDAILSSYPDATIGMAYGGEGEAYDLTFYRPKLVFAGNPLLMDVIAVMENEQAHRELPRQTYEALASGQVTVWMVPKGFEPFTKLNWYPPHHPVFPEDFLAVLHEKYEHRDESEFFDLWVWNGGPAPRAASLPPSDGAGL